MRILIALVCCIAAAQAVAASPEEEFYQECEAMRQLRISQRQRLVLKREEELLLIRQAEPDPAAKRVEYFQRQIIFRTQAEKDRNITHLQDRLNNTKETLSNLRNNTQLAVPTYQFGIDLSVGKKGYLDQGGMKCIRTMGQDLALMELGTRSLFMVKLKGLGVNNVVEGKKYYSPHKVCWHVSGTYQYVDDRGDTKTVPLLEEYDLAPVIAIWEARRKGSPVVAPVATEIERP